MFRFDLGQGRFVLRRGIREERLFLFSGLEMVLRGLGLILFGSGLGQHSLSFCQGRAKPSRLCLGRLKSELEVILFCPNFDEVSLALAYLAFEQVDRFLPDRSLVERQLFLALRGNRRLTLVWGFSGGTSGNQEGCENESISVCDSSYCLLLAAEEFFDSEMILCRFV